MFDNLEFRLYQETESDKLEIFLTTENWPFHGSENPTMEKVKKWISDGDFTGEDNRTFWIYLMNNPVPIGIVFLHELTDYTPIFDLRVLSKVRNKGIGKKVLKWLTRYVFTETDKHRIEGHTRVDNIPMQKVFKSCGWVKEAYYRQAWPDSNKQFYDAVTYAILKSDWETGKITTIDWSDCL